MMKEKRIYFIAMVCLLSSSMWALTIPQGTLTTLKPVITP